MTTPTTMSSFNQMVASLMGQSLNDDSVETCSNNTVRIKPLVPNPPAQPMISASNDLLGDSSNVVTPSLQTSYHTAFNEIAALNVVLSVLNRSIELVSEDLPRDTSEVVSIDLADFFKNWSSGSLMDNTQRSYKLEGRTDLAIESLTKAVEIAISEIRLDIKSAFKGKQTSVPFNFSSPNNTVRTIGHLLSGVLLTQIEAITLGSIRKLVEANGFDGGQSVQESLSEVSLDEVRPDVDLSVLFGTESRKVHLESLSHSAKTIKKRKLPSIDIDATQECKESECHNSLRDSGSEGALEKEVEQNSITLKVNTKARKPKTRKKLENTTNEVSMLAGSEGAHLTDQSVHEKNTPTQKIKGSSSRGSGGRFSLSELADVQTNCRTLDDLTVDEAVALATGQDVEIPITATSAQIEQRNLEEAERIRMKIQERRQFRSMERSAIPSANRILFEKPGNIAARMDLDISGLASEINQRINDSRYKKR